MMIISLSITCFYKTLILIFFSSSSLFTLNCAHSSNILVLLLLLVVFGHLGVVVTYLLFCVLDLFFLGEGGGCFFALLILDGEETTIVLASFSFVSKVLGAVNIFAYNSFET